MSRLVVCGCSYTYGHGLPDCRFDGVKYTDMNQIATASKLCWGQVAADTLGMEYVNLSSLGESNRYIAYKLSEFKYQPGDIVVPMWTHFSRRSWINAENVSLPLGSWQSLDTDDVDLIDDQQTSVSTAYYRYMYNDLDAVFENLVYINFVNLFVKNLGLRIINTCTHKGTAFREYITSKIVYRVPWNQVDAELVFTDYTDLGVEYDGHPNTESHRSFALRLVNHIKST